MPCRSRGAQLLQIKPLDARLDQNRTQARRASLRLRLSTVQVLKQLKWYPFRFTQRN